MSTKPPLPVQLVRGLKELWGVVRSTTCPLCDGQAVANTGTACAAKRETDLGISPEHGSLALCDEWLIQRLGKGANVS